VARYVDVEQNTEEWARLRLGIPTASEFSRIVTGAGKASAQADKYRLTLLSEWMIDGPVEQWAGNQWTERGKLLEPEAVAWYEFESGNEVRPGGFVTRDDGLVGASPDGLVGDDGLLELKCPSAWVHLQTLLSDEVPSEHRQQTQGELYVSERRWVDFVSYYPGMPKFRRRVTRDETFLRAFQQVLGTFLARMLEGRQKLIDMGYKQ
jgi:putative phage-type endonuclease